MEDSLYRRGEMKEEGLMIISVYDNGADFGRGDREAASSEEVVSLAALRSLAFTLGDELASHGIHVDTITIAGNIERNTHFDPDLINYIYPNLIVLSNGQILSTQGMQISYL